MDLKENLTVDEAIARIRKIGVDSETINICYVLNPEVVVLGGGIMAQEEYLAKKIRGAVDKYLVASIASRTRIAFARHRNDAGMLGAFYHFKSLHAR